MVVVHTYTRLRDILVSLGTAGKNASLIEEVRRGALDITEAVLYVKQHSVNCVSAAMYAMTRFDAGLFPSEEAALFTEGLFLQSDTIGAENAARIREHILSLYRRFLDEGRSASSWREPLLAFLRSSPKKKGAGCYDDQR
jgi:hypothetical protein